MSSLSDHVPAYLAQWRRAKDRAATVSITAGGAGVLLAILLIFFYLLYEVLPLFGSAHIEQRTGVSWAVPAQVEHVAVEEQGEVAFLLDASGTSRFVVLDSGETLSSHSHGEVTAIAPAGAQSRLLALAASDGGVRLLQHEYGLSYPDGKRLITPRLEYPFSDSELSLGSSAIDLLAISEGEEALILAGKNTKGELIAVRYSKEEDFLSGELTLEEDALELPLLPGETAAIYLGTEQRWLYRLDGQGNYTVLDLKRQEGGVQLIADQGSLFTSGADLSSSELLLGGLSLLAASDAGELAQFFMVRD